MKNPPFTNMIRNSAAPIAIEAVLNPYPAPYIRQWIDFGAAELPPTFTAQGATRQFAAGLLIIPHPHHPKKGDWEIRVLVNGVEVERHSGEKPFSGVTALQPFAIDPLLKAIVTIQCRRNDGWWYQLQSLEEVDAAGLDLSRLPTGAEEMSGNA